MTHDDRRPPREFLTFHIATPPGPGEVQDDQSRTWWAIIPMVVLSLVLMASGVFLVVVSPGVDGPAATFSITSFGVGLVAGGLCLLSSFGVLGWYVLQIPRLRRRRVTAVGDATGVLTDLDVRCWSVPAWIQFRYPAGTGKVGPIRTGPGASTPALRVAAVAGRIFAAISVLALLVAVLTPLVVGIASA